MIVLAFIVKRVYDTKLIGRFYCGIPTIDTGSITIGIRASCVFSRSSIRRSTRFSTIGFRA